MATKLGKITINEVDIYQLDSDPSLGVGFQAPMGSLGLIKEANSKIYQKFGAAATDWGLPTGTQSFFSVENTDITTNLNLNTIPTFETQIPITGVVVIPSSDYTVVGNLIRANFSGKVLVTATLELESSNSNAEMFIRLGKNLTTFFGNRNTFKQAYANRPTILTGVVDVAPNDTIGIFTERQANAGTINMGSPNESRINIVRV